MNTVKDSIELAKLISDDFIPNPVDKTQYFYHEQGDIGVEIFKLFENEYCIEFQILSTSVAYNISVYKFNPEEKSLNCVMILKMICIGYIVDNSKEIDKFISSKGSLNIELNELC